MHRRESLSLLACVLLGACSSLPAEGPPQLRHTPGAMVVVEERTLQTSSFQLDPPAGWRIVKRSIASEPMGLVLVAPNETTVISIGEAPVDSFTEAAAFVQREAVVTLPDGQTVYLAGQARREDEAAFDAFFAAVEASVRLPR